MGTLYVGYKYGIAYPIKQFFTEEQIEDALNEDDGKLSELLAIGIEVSHDFDDEPLLLIAVPLTKFYGEYFSGNIQKETWLKDLIKLDLKVLEKNVLLLQEKANTIMGKQLFTKNNFDFYSHTVN